MTRVPIDRARFRVKPLRHQDRVDDFDSGDADLGVHLGPALFGCEALDETLWRATIRNVRTLKATVKNGRLVLDEPSDLPDGTEVELVPLDEFDPEELDAAALAELRRSWERGNSEGWIPAADLIDRLRK